MWPTPCAATKISFINEMANICERAEADINERPPRPRPRQPHRLRFPLSRRRLWRGCPPKDVRAQAAVARARSVDPRVLWTPLRRYQRLPKVCPAGEDHTSISAASWAGLTIGSLGAGFQAEHGRYPARPPSLVLIEGCLPAGAKLRVYDPEAAPENIRHARWPSALTARTSRRGARRRGRLGDRAPSGKHFIVPTGLACAAPCGSRSSSTAATSTAPSA